MDSVIIDTLLTVTITTDDIQPMLLVFMCSLFGVGCVISYDIFIAWRKRRGQRNGG